ncbi:MAG: hypothetical protein WBC70_16515 [Candidatus Aminicenantales bacterium]
MIALRIIKAFVALMAVSAIGLLAARAPVQKTPIPWKFAGYEKIDELHLKYWSPSKDAFEDWENFTKDGFPTEISEVWFSKKAQSFRVDKYVEKEHAVKCNAFKGKEWEIITEGGKEYVLKERLIQVGAKRTFHYLENILSGGGKELCEYKVSESQREAPASVTVPLRQLTLSPYMPDEDGRELIVAGLELDEALDPQKYKATVQELKKTHEKAGRKTAKWEIRHSIIRFAAQGYVFVDLEWGMALEGYIAEIQSGSQIQTLANPVCIYRVLSLETKIADPGVFGE